MSAVDTAWRGLFEPVTSTDESAPAGVAEASVGGGVVVTTLSFVPLTTPDFEPGVSRLTILTSTGQNPGVQAVRVPLPALSGYLDNPTALTFEGSLWDPNVGAGAFVASFCDVAGATCDVPAGLTVTNSLTTDGSGAISGGNLLLERTSFAEALTTGSRAIKVTQGTNSALVPVLVLGEPTLDRVSSGGPGTPDVVWGSNMNPNQPVYARAFVAADRTSRVWTESSDPAAVPGTAASNGIFGPLTITVTDGATTALGAWQGESTTGDSASNPRVSTASSVGDDRCVTWFGGEISVSCTTSQYVSVSVLSGRLTQRAYANPIPTSGSVDGSVITFPIPGTSNVNGDASTVNLGTITSPLAPVRVVGNMNDITVSDNRGSAVGWTLSATMSTFTNVPSGELPSGALSATPTCEAATAANAWDYNAADRSPIAGFDPSLIAPGVTAGAPNQSFATTVNLCTKSNEVNPQTQSTGGVWNVGSPLTLVIPAFQPAGKYTATMTITLA